MHLFLFALRFLSARSSLVVSHRFPDEFSRHAMCTPLLEILSRNSTYEYNDFTRFSYFPLETVVRSFSSVNFPFVTHGEGNPCFESSLTSFSFNVKYPMFLPLSLCILIPLISKRSFELTFRGSSGTCGDFRAIFLPPPLPRWGHGIRIRLLYR